MGSYNIWVAEEDVHKALQNAALSLISFQVYAS